MLNTCELCSVFHSLFYRTNGLSTIAGNAERDAGWGWGAVLSLESGSSGVCGACGLFMGRWPVGKLTCALGLRRKVIGLEQIRGSSVQE